MHDGQSDEELRTEQVAGDITFDTQGIASNVLLAEAVAKYREESEINDIPYETVCIISANYNMNPLT